LNGNEKNLGANPGGRTGSDSGGLRFDIDEDAALVIENPGITGRRRRGWRRKFEMQRLPEAPQVPLKASVALA